MKASARTCSRSGGRANCVLFRALEWCATRLKLHFMAQVPLRSPSEKVGGLFYFGRMLDKIRLHAKGELPSDYHANLGKGLMKNA